MNITLLVVGKTDEKYLQEGIDVYTKRLKHYVNFDLVVIPALKDQKGATPDEVKEREAALILKHTAKSDRILLLDEFSSSLDPDTEQRLMENLTAQAAGKTMIFITHREKISEYCDRSCRIERQA